MDFTIYEHFAPTCPKLYKNALTGRPMHVRNLSSKQKPRSKERGFLFVEKISAPQRALFSRSVSGIKKASSARLFDTSNSIESVVSIEGLSKNHVFRQPQKNPVPKNGVLSCQKT
nr:hypothetical protein [uncultured Agathobaculum sp.]